MSEPNDRHEEITSALTKLADMIESEKMVVFTPKEATLLKEAVVWLDRFKSSIIMAQAIGRSTGGLVKWIAMAAIAWAAFKLELFEWLKDGLSDSSNNP